MKVVVNGQPEDMTVGTTVHDVVVGLGRDPERPGVAVAVDGDVVTRGAWATTTLHEGAVVEIVAAVQGG